MRKRLQCYSRNIKIPFRLSLFFNSFCFLSAVWGPSLCLSVARLGYLLSSRRLSVLSPFCLPHEWFFALIGSISSSHSSSLSFFLSYRQTDSSICELFSSSVPIPRPGDAYLGRLLVFFGPLWEKSRKRSPDLAFVLFFSHATTSVVGSSTTTHHAFTVSQSPYRSILSILISSSCSTKLGVVET